MRLGKQNTVSHPYCYIMFVNICMFDLFMMIDGAIFVQFKHY